MFSIYVLGLHLVCMLPIFLLGLYMDYSFLSGSDTELAYTNTELHDQPYLFETGLRVADLELAV